MSMLQGLRRASLVAAVAVGFAGLAQAQAPSNPDEIIASRQAGYKHMGENMEAIKKALDAGQDVAPLAPRVQEIVDYSKKIPTLFPVGTETGHGTHALPTVWSERPQFEKNSANLTTESTKLLTLASANDKAAFADQYKVVGGTCGACHRVYRARLN